MKTVYLLCLALLLLPLGCTGNSGGTGGAEIRPGNKEEITECNHYRMCYQNDIQHTRVCMKWNTQWSKERMPQLQRLYLLKNCYLDKDEVRDECFGTDSKEVRLLKIEECKQIGIDPAKPTNK